MGLRLLPAMVGLPPLVPSHPMKQAKWRANPSSPICNSVTRLCLPKFNLRMSLRFHPRMERRNLRVKFLLDLSLSLWPRPLPPCRSPVPGRPLPGPAGCGAATRLCPPRRRSRPELRFVVSPILRLRPVACYHKKVCSHPWSIPGSRPSPTASAPCQGGIGVLQAFAKTPCVLRHRASPRADTPSLASTQG